MAMAMSMPMPMPAMQWQWNAQNNVNDNVNDNDNVNVNVNDNVNDSVNDNDNGNDNGNALPLARARPRLGLGHIIYKLVSKTRSLSSYIHAHFLHGSHVVVGMFINYDKFIDCSVSTTNENVIITERSCPTWNRSYCQQPITLLVACKVTVGRLTYWLRWPAPWSKAR